MDMRKLILTLLLISAKCAISQPTQFLLMPKKANSATYDTIALLFTNAASVPTNWNKVASTTIVNNLVYLTSGSNSGANCTLSAQTGTSINTAPYCTTPTYFTTTMYERTSRLAGTSRTVTIGSLPNGTYRVEMMGSRAGTSSNQFITINSNNSNTVNANNNCGSICSLDGVSVSGNTMTITVTSDVSNNYINTILLIKPQ